MPNNSWDSRFLAWLRWMLYFADQRPVETLHSMLTFAWGFWVAMPWPIFTRANVFAGLARVASETVWGWLAMCIGLLHLIGVSTGSFRGRQWSAFLRVVLWTFFGVLFFAGDWRTVAWLVYGGLAISTMWVYLRLRETP